MKSKVLILLIVVLVALLGGLTWLMLAARDPLFHGKPESEWIKGIAYGVSLPEHESQAQIKRWRDFGADGVRVLARAVEKADQPIRRTYRKIHRRVSPWLPVFLVRLLPDPGSVVTGGPPMAVIDLLSRLGEEAEAAAPAVARTLKSEDAGVRNSAVIFFGGEGENPLLNRMDPKAKRKLLPDFIRAVEDGRASWSLRNNAAIALRCYPEQREVVAPVLVKALQDSSPWVRQSAAEALNRVAPDLIRSAGVVPIVIGVLKDPDDQIAWRAALWLGEMRTEPALAVPALVESLESPSSLVAATAAQALTRYKEQADQIIPALEKAAQRKDTAGGWAKSAAKQLESETAAKQGVK
ncbi:MAG: HEAT repeat domain-containing protein [Verrucomicrobia bacterium]|nr:HEAT repeat domain-containing protein [Verrucomicrobiota bacterium]